MNKPQLKHIAELAYRTLFRQAPDLCEIQETFYGWVVFLASEKGRVVVKFSREIGRLRKEVEGLGRLREAVSCKVPEVLFFGREQGYSYLVLEWVDGVSAHQLPTNKEAIQTFSHSYIDILLSLHDVSSPEGFENDHGEFEPHFTHAFEQWMAPVYRYVMSDGSPFSPELKESYLQLWEMKNRILTSMSPQSSLVHDDCHLGNVLFDPKTYKVSAILDPCDVGFKHREMDLFHLYDVRPELNLVEEYTQQHPIDDEFTVRRWFFSLWDDAKHSRNMGWYDEAWLQDKVDKFNRCYYQ
ncbi:phosphotransferase [Photobacterium minamisatsumaniensis]|uniref:phosphotransferase n=1 Tax=Photobacterium minamisatsumaniensis TaxID=2910233 RepID=UPI003D1370FE